VKANIAAACSALLSVGTVAAGLTTTACTTAQQSAPAIAITIDDLPVHAPYPRDESALTATKEILAALKAEKVEAYGFVNAVWTEREPGSRQALEAWAAAGQPIGNHGFAHRHLSEMSAEEFEQELVKNEPTLEGVSGGRDWKWFRYPFIDEGESAEKRAASRAILARHGYKIADVTMDFSDWAFTAPYARCRDAGDTAAVAKLEQFYMQAAKEGIAYYRARAQQDHKRDIPYVLLLHVSAFEGRMLPQLLKLYREHAFRFVTLAQAEADSAYIEALEPQRPAKPQMATQDRAPLPTRTDYQPILASMCKT
jgi:peptidoglycan/xylan/chitin deacetylase (PgdA/CDA1 family)